MNSRKIHYRVAEDIFYAWTRENSFLSDIIDWWRKAMNNREAIIIDNLIDQREKGYVDDPDDSGGPTKYGITIDTLSDYRGKKCTAQDVKELPRLEATQILNSMYIYKPRFYCIRDDALFELVFDIGVLHGTGTSIKMLQKVLGVKQDGIIGPITENKLLTADIKTTYLNLCGERLEYIIDILKAAPYKIKFAKGWVRRSYSFVRKVC